MNTSQLSCLANLVGVSARDCQDGITPTSNYYIDSFTGIKLSIADKTHPEDYENGRQMVLDKIALAGNLLIEELASAMPFQPRADALLSIENLGQTYDVLPELLSLDATKFRGVRIEYQVEADTVLLLSKIGFISQTSGAINVLVYNYKGGLLSTISVTAVAGQMVFVDTHVELRSEGGRVGIIVGYVATVGSYQNQEGTSLSDNCDLHVCDCNGDLLYVQGVEWTQGNQPAQASMSTVGHMNGLSVTVSIGCDARQFWCSVKDRLALPLAYRSIMELVEEARFSTRRNEVISGRKEDLESLYSMYKEKYEEAVKRVISGIKMPANSRCWSCNSLVTARVQIP